MRDGNDIFTFILIAIVAVFMFASLAGTFGVNFIGFFVVMGIMAVVTWILHRSGKFNK